MTLKKTALTYGLLSAAVSIAMMFITVPFITPESQGTADVLGYTSILLSAPGAGVEAAVRQPRHQCGADVRDVVSDRSRGRTHFGCHSQKEVIMRIWVTSVMVDDQDRALKFYTDVLGFIKKNDVPVGEARWLTIVSPEGPAEVELLLEPMGFGPARAYQKALFDAGITLTSFAVDDIRKEHARLEKLGVVFQTPPTEAGPVTIAAFEDTCGNLIQIVQL